MPAIAGHLAEIFLEKRPHPDLPREPPAHGITCLFEWVCVPVERAYNLTH